MVYHRRIKLFFWMGSAAIITIMGLTGLELYIRLSGKTPAYQVGWFFRGNPEEANEWGVRGRKAKAPGDSILLITGDSQVKARAQTLDDMPESMLERSLNARGVKGVRIASLGESGWGQDVELLALRKFLPEIRPKWVVLWFTPHNDLWNNTFPTDMPTNGPPKPTFWLDNGELKGPHLNWLSHYNRHDWHIARYLSFRMGEPPYPSDQEWEAKLPPSYPSLPAPREKVPGLLECIEALYHQETSHWKGHEQYENFLTEKTHFSILLDPPSPRTEYSVRLTRALLQEIQREVTQQGAELLVAYAPNVQFERLFQLYGDSFVVAWQDGYYRLSQKALELNVRRVLEGFSHVRLDKLPPGSSISNSDSHLNNTGIEAVMNSIADYTTQSPSGWFAVKSR